LIMKLLKGDRDNMTTIAGGGTHASSGVCIVHTLLLVMILSAPSLSSRGQTYPYREYTIDDGMPQSESMSVFQDSRGFIWIPTRNGLARFDGHTFIPYLRKDGLPSNNVTRVFEDRAGTIWAVTVNGLARFNGRNFNSYPLPDSLGIKNMGMGCDYGDTATFLLSGAVSTDRDKILLFRKGKYYDYSSLHPALAGKTLLPSAFDTSDSTLYLINGSFEVFKFHNETLTLFKEGPWTNGTITDDGPQFTNEMVGYRIRASHFVNEIRGVIPILTDREGATWLSTESRIFRLISDAFIEYNRDNGLPENTWALVADPSGGLWTGSINGELKYFDGKQFVERNEYLKLYDYPPPFYRGSTTLSSGEVWFSTGLGVLIWNGKSFRKLDLLKGSHQICIIYEDPVDGRILIGSDKGLHIIDGRKVTSYSEMSWTEFGIAEGIARDHDGNYWIAGHYGIVFFDGTNFVPFRSAPAPAEMVWGVVCDYMGNIWSAGSDGIYICDPDEQIFNEALPDELNLPANVIRDLGDRRLIVGRMMDICIIDLEKYYSGQPDYYSIIGRSRGFTGNDCQDNGIVREADGNWWILSSDKLIRFDPEKIVKNNYPPMTHITLVEIPGDTTEWVTVIDSALFYEKNSRLNIRGRQNSVRISYTGISTRNPEDVTYMFRMRGFDDNWSKNSKERSVIFTDLPPGEYIFEVSAINADGVISEEPDRLEINVVPTFLQSIFARIMFVLLTIALVVFLSLQIRKNVIERRIAAARQQADSYRLQLNSVIKQFDPHFTFNAVTSVGSLIMKGEKEKAYNYFIKLSNLLRSIISDSTVLLKPLEQELEFVTRYCELQKLRFGNRFEYEITVAEDVDLKTPVPKMIIQSFTENSLKHGLENKKGLGLVEIKITHMHEGIEVTVRDNGIGRAAASELHTGGAGIGLKNISSIIEAMNKANKEKITLTLTDLYDNGKASGTEVRVFLPHNYSLDFPAEMQ
jgi:ligand-binding sensor domain-containing protein